MKRMMKTPTQAAGGMGLLAFLLLAVSPLGEAYAQGICRPCYKVAIYANLAERGAARNDYQLAIGKSIYITDPEQRAEAKAEALEEFRAATLETRDVYLARRALCISLNECTYDPDMDPANFCTPEEAADNPNPFFPLTPGLKLTYEGLTDEGELETIVVDVLDETVEILGITCTVVRDVVTIEGELVEDTADWYAQDKDGNVWYMGELSKNYEDGELVDLDGSWKAGTDGAKAGILTHADPAVGLVFRQEWLLGEAEDAAEILALDVDGVTVPAGTFDDCRQTAEFTPLEPDGLEHKFFAPGIGMVLEVKPETGEMVELISVEFPE